MELINAHDTVVRRGHWKAIGTMEALVLIFSKIIAKLHVLEAWWSLAFSYRRLPQESIKHEILFLYSDPPTIVHSLLFLSPFRNMISNIIRRYNIRVQLNLCERNQQLNSNEKIQEENGFEWNW